MRYFIIITLLILAGVGALFIIKDNDALLLGTIAVVIVGFWFAVMQIAKEEPDSDKY